MSSIPTPTRSYFRLSTPEAMRVARHVASRNGSIDADILRDWTNRYMRAKERRETFGERVSSNRAAQGSSK